MLRPYQREALHALHAAYRRGIHRMVVSLPTGTGKTTIFPALLDALAPTPTDAMLVIAHRHELIDQAAARLAHDLPGVLVATERSTARAQAHARVVVASVQSLHAQRAQRFFARFPARFGVLTIDECHHAVTNAYQRLIERVAQDRPDAAIVGFTATVQRADRKALGSVFEEIVYHRDLRWAVEAGWLVAPRCYTVTTNTDLSNVPSLHGDFAPAKLAQAVNTHHRNACIVDAYQRYLHGKRTIVFCTSVAHAQSVCEGFAHAGVRAAWACGKTPAGQRADILHAYRTGGIDVLVNCLLWTEGFDEPTTEAIINARPSEHPSVYMQILGRGTRPHPSIANDLGQIAQAHDRRAQIAGSPKPELTVVDLLDSTKRSLATIPSLFNLPATLRLHGSSIVTALARYDQLAAHDPLAAQSVGSLAHIETLLHEVDRFHVRERHPDATLTWITADDERYAITFPPRWKTANSDLHETFSRAYLDAARTDRRTAHETACRHLGLEPSSVRCARERVTIDPDPHGYDVTLDTGFQRERLAHAPSLSQAFAHAERWIAQHRPEAAHSLRATATWRAKPPTPAQIELLTGDLQVPFHLVPATRGDAHSLIVSLHEQASSSLKGELLATSEREVV